MSQFIWKEAAWLRAFMQHLAIMKKSWGFIDKILHGQKTIESRWYSNKSKPWDNIKEGELVYFKDTGGLVRARAEVESVKQYDNLTPNLVNDILAEYAGRIGLEPGSVPEFRTLFKDKKYCILIFLKNVKEVPMFDIDKKGFGSMSAWISADNILSLKK